MQKLAVIFVAGLEKNPAQMVRLTGEAILGASKKTGIFAKGGDFEIVPVHVIDIQTLWGLQYNANKFGIKHFLHTNDKDNMDPMKTVLAVGPAEPERLNKLSANLRLF